MREAQQETLLEIKAELSTAEGNPIDEKARKRVEELELARIRLEELIQEDDMVGPPLSSHKAPLEESGSQKSAGDSLGKGSPEARSRSEPKEGIDMAHQADRGMSPGQGRSHQTQMLLDMASLSQEDRDSVTQLATKLFNIASEQQKSNNLLQLRKTMSAAQLEDMSRQEINPLMWFYQNQAFQILKVNTDRKQQQLDLDTLQIEQPRKFQCDECSKVRMFCCSS
jgi:hypothetical protein